MQSAKGETISIINPKDDSVVSDKVQVAGPEDIDSAVKAAQAAFPAWKALAGAKRGAIMLKFADLLEKNADRLAELESNSMGQPISVAKRMLAGPIALWRYYAGYAGKVGGESYPPDEDGTYKIVQYEPLGVCAGICAWNGSHVLAAWKMAPAMAAGNVFILKSSEKSPVALAQYGDILNEAGFPPGVVNIVTGAGETGSLLASHMDIAKIAFTGSAFAGRAVQVAAAKSNLKRVTLELGGKSPALIFDDADIPNAVFHTSEGFLRNSGQICFASSRVLVQEGIAPEYIKTVKVAYEKAGEAMGDQSLAETKFGPLADKKQFDRVMGFLDDAKKEGIEVLTGGGRKGDKGTFVQPTVLLNPDLKSKVYTGELMFGASSSSLTSCRRDFRSCHQRANIQDRRGGHQVGERYHLRPWMYVLIVLLLRLWADNIKPLFTLRILRVRYASLVRSRLAPSESIQPSRHHSRHRSEDGSRQVTDENPASRD